MTTGLRQHAYSLLHDYRPDLIDPSPVSPSKSSPPVGRYSQLVRPVEQNSQRWRNGDWCSLGRRGSGIQVM